MTARPDCWPRLTLGGFQYFAGDPGHRAVGCDQPARAMAEFQRDAPFRDVLAHATLEHLDHARPGAPCQMEARHGIAVAVRKRAAAFGPADDRPPAHAHPVQPGAHLAGGEIDESLGDLAGPKILGTVELRRAQPVLPGKISAVPDAEATLLRRVDHEQAAERPPSLAAEEIAALLLQDDDALARIGEFGRGNEAGKPGADDDCVGFVCHRLLPAGIFGRICVEWAPALLTFHSCGANTLHGSAMPRSLCSPSGISGRVVSERRLPRAARCGREAGTGPPAG